MKAILLICKAFLFLQAGAQEQTQHFRYLFKTAAYIQLEMLPTETKVFDAQMIWHTVRDRRFMLLYIGEVKTESDIEGGIEKENWNDTLLFDLEKYKLYSANEKRCYRFNRKRFQLNREDRFISNDTLIVCSPQIPVWASPSPTLILNKGLKVYKTRRYTFMLIDAKKSEKKLAEYFERYQHFKFSNGESRFAY
ncbi:MAG: hypothetical protein EOO01_06025 [Chitinophagaceae bacterium]|nr:MAG: hypothetical protein EOO01_06025 [Chitinophagaceae bacterium]